MKTSNVRGIGICMAFSDDFSANTCGYAELHCISNYSFLRGASFPEELVSQAAALGYQALALTDECSLSGVVRAHVQALQSGIKFIVGSEFVLQDGLHFVVLAPNRQAYAELCALISLARRQADKGSYYLERSHLQKLCLQQVLVLWLPSASLLNSEIKSEQEQKPGSLSNLQEQVTFLRTLFARRLWIAVACKRSGNDRQHLEYLVRMGRRYHVSLCASGGVDLHVPERRYVRDTLTAIRLNQPLSRLGYALPANAESYLRPLSLLRSLFPQDLLRETLSIAQRCEFCLSELRYEYPRELVPKGYSLQAWLQHLTHQGMQRRWPQGEPDKVRRMVCHELKLIREMNYEPYFLTVYDIVRYARSKKILCQGRGSAANSAVCYCLGITEVDPGRMQLLFERFISKERNEPPDIDVDFEHERREEVIQYIYRKYGRHRAALAATIVTYQPRSAIRDVGKALGFSLDQVDTLAQSYQWWDGKQLYFDTSLDNHSPMMKRLRYLVGALLGFPRHLSQHVGGFVIAADALDNLVPTENAAMPERTVIQWEKDDLEALGLLKIDVLSLGMLTAIRKALDYISSYQGKALTMQDIPAEDPKVYGMMQRADTIGVFQIESRAQMSMLPRLRPANYYDLVIQIAIVRPGPIQGDMVHPYLARRQGKQAVTYPNKEVEQVLQRTLGVPIFQEQVMQLAMVAAGFSAGEADQLRRSMAAWRRRGGLEQFGEKLKAGMTQRGYSAEFAEQIFRQILGFGEYGFPESHSASFALLAYASSWIKCYHPAAFTCALLNSQPMGFYAPAQLVQDAQRHSVSVRPVDVCFSDYDCTLEMDAGETCKASKGTAQPTAVLRLGMRMVKGLSEQAAKRIVQVRKHTKLEDLQQLAALAHLDKKDLQSLAAADALAALEGNRHRAFWQVLGIEQSSALFDPPRYTEADPLLAVPGEGDNIVHDYASLGLSLRRHPLALLRERLTRHGIMAAHELSTLSNNSLVKVAGIVVNRQRPSTASGVIFLTLEDESGYSNIIVWPKTVDAQRKVLLKASLMGVHGRVQAQDGVIYVIAGKLEDLSSYLGALKTQSRDFH